MPRVISLVAVMTAWAISGTSVVGQSRVGAIAITRVDGSGFPQVVAGINVSDATGLPIAGLGTSDFTITEDGKPVSGAKVEGETALVSIVYALDVATDRPSLNTISNALKAQSLLVGGKDRLGLVTYGEKATVALEPTDNKAVFEREVNAAPVGGQFTAFNDGLLLSIKTAAAQKDANVGVIAITDSGDNAPAGAAIADITTAARNARVPIYVIGYGNKPKPAALLDLAQQTGGQYFNQNTAEDVARVLALIAPGLRQSYRLTFRSQLQADSAPHKLVVSTNGASTEGAFVAVPGKLSVTLPRMSDGIRLSNGVTLVPQITSPAPISKVTFTLDGQQIGESSVPPYAFDWNSQSVPAGEHTLVASVLDTAGNKGETKVRVVTEAIRAAATAPPIVVTSAPVIVQVPATPSMVWLNTLLRILSAIVVAVMSGSAIFALIRWWRGGLRKEYKLEFVNTGNVDSHYDVWGSDSQDTIHFRFLVNNELIGETGAKKVSKKVQAGDAASSLKNAGQKASQVGSTAGQVIGTVGAISSFIGRAAKFLPPAIGKPIIDLTKGISTARYAAYDATMAPKRIAQQLAVPTLISSNVPKLSIAGVGGGGSSGNSATQTAQATETMSSTDSEWPVTPAVPAGASLMVTVVAEPKSWFGLTPGKLELKTKSHEASAMGDASTLQTQALSFGGAETILLRLLPPAAIVLVLAAGLFGVVWLLRGAL